MSHADQHVLDRLVATIGARSSSGRISRKTIQEVDVRKAVGKIMNPEAPLALRLQGNLLYGVSRVYSEKCTYVLDDAERVRTAMKTFARLIRAAEAVTDPKAGKASRKQNIIQDDEGFNIDNFVLPVLELGENGFLLPRSSQHSSKASQMSPAELASSGGSAGSARGFDFPLPDNSSYILENPFGSISAQKSMSGQLEFANDDLVPIADFGIEVGPDGELIEIGPQSQLLDLEEHIIQMDAGMPRPPPTQEDRPMQSMEGDIIMEEVPLPNPDELHGPRCQEPPTIAAQPEANEAERQAGAPARRGRPPQTALLLDDRTSVPKQELRAWSTTYVQRAEAQLVKKPRITPAMARRNAFMHVFGTGIGNVGEPTGIAGLLPPLADIFAGHVLRDVILGQSHAAATGRRRSASEAFEEEKEEEGDDRRVRQRTEDAEQGRTVEDAELPFFPGDDELPEIGREGNQSLGEQRGSSLMPWSRHGSAVPGSSVKSIGSAQKLPGSGRIQPSPLAGRGGPAPDISRFSDPAGQYSDGLNPLHSDQEFGLLPGDDTSFGGFENNAFIGPEQGDSQWSRSGIDNASLEFLMYAKDQIKEKGDIMEQDNKPSRKWIDFEHLADPVHHSKAVAAQAFFHVLSLATKNELSVTQLDRETEPFGKILLGIDIEVDEEEDADDIQLIDI